jgi:GNAT superfamily N-acetyltransferase
VAQSPSSGLAIPEARNFGYDIRPAWRRGDPRIEADAIDFWTRNGLLPPGVDPAARAKELVAAAYKDGRLAAVSTATLEHAPHLRARFFVMRGATDPEFRRSQAQRALAVSNYDLLSRWALDHPQEDVAGQLAFADMAEWGDYARVPIWRESRLQLAGYTDDGRQVRLRWFDHYRIGGPPVTEPFQIPDLATGLSGISLREAWRRDDAGIEADVIQFWQRLRLLPSEADPAARAKEILLAAYDGDRVIGVMTAEVGRVDRVRARLAMTRGAVDPAYRRRQIGRVMHLMHRAIVEQWARDHPEEQVAGLGGIVQSAVLAEQARAPYSPIHHYMLIGYTPDGHQLRVSWFDWARVALT